MKIVVINGNARHGSTWHCKELLTETISKLTESQIAEFSLPKDMPHFCNGCFSCFFNGEETCPHASAVQPIVAVLEAADLVIMTSPVYGLDVSGQLKSLLDHLCFMWLSHRPNPKLFNTVGISLTTTAGAGLSHTTKTMQNSFKFWGLKKTYAVKFPVAASKWDEVSQKNRLKIEKKLERLAKKAVNAVEGIERKPSPAFRSMMFAIMKSMMKKNKWNPTDRIHWEAQGWLDGKKPF